MFMKKAREYVDVNSLDRPKRRLDAMIDLRTEILKLCDGFHAQFKAVTDRIMSEVHDPEMDDGLLEIDVDQYMDCMNVDLAVMDKLLVEEITKKEKDLEIAEEAAQALIEKW
jgi:hypothetical protein